MVSFLQKFFVNIYSFQLGHITGKRFFVGSGRGYMNYYSGLHLHCFTQAKTVGWESRKVFTKKEMSFPLRNGVWRNYTKGWVHPRLSHQVFSKMKGTERCMHCWPCKDMWIKHQNEQHRKLQRPSPSPTNHFIWNSKFYGIIGQK